MKRLEPVIWTKGTFLSPQYLQLQDRFLENVLQFHLESLSFRPYGFRSLQISQEALAAGSLHIASASGILPDGLLFGIDKEIGVPLWVAVPVCAEAAVDATPVTDDLKIAPLFWFSDVHWPVFAP